jgi:hypothetical protein
MLSEGRKTYHGKSGKFCGRDNANIVTKDGDRYKVVRQHRRMKPKSPGVITKTKKSKRQVATEMVRHMVAAQDRVESVSMVMSGQRFVSLGDVLGEAKPIGGWKKTGGGWPSKESPSYETNTVVGKAKLFKKGKKWVLSLAGKEHEMPKRRPSLDHAEGMILDIARKAGKVSAPSSAKPKKKRYPNLSKQLKRHGLGDIKVPRAKKGEERTKYAFDMKTGKKIGPLTPAQKKSLTKQMVAKREPAEAEKEEPKSNGKGRPGWKMVFGKWRKVEGQRFVPLDRVLSG